MILQKKQSTAADKKRKLYTFLYPDSGMTDQFHTMRTNIKFLTENKSVKTVLFTSSAKKDGKTTAAVNLASLLAHQKEKVLLIDANLRNPVIHHYFQLENNEGLTAVLKGKKHLNEVLIKNDLNKLDVLTGGQGEYNPAELLSGEQMKQLLQKVSQDYDAVIIDGPNMIDYTETRVLAHISDGVIIVVRRGKTLIDRGIELKRILELAHANIIGAIINNR
ncbi:CpsD/CapB family tyrosine-protein kinase [Jeotgalibacillus malaysiensis]|uniref:CpsD/CapB family tyrosine-protein kinase n=1 Tax=Jeotgalibacillus malaysiensis TaxID=1508404 RepID=UPI00384B55EB